ncbi:hypothetical protein B0H10DRAFT_298175 [Mycena sp. CBHHK59/15]|nr:hypothetical protein B0H10DRAFT_298175 [Mycena sp. CBHHK59/15]
MWRRWCALRPTTHSLAAPRVALPNMPCPALDILWREQETIMHTLRCLPADLLSFTLDELGREVAILQIRLQRAGRPISMTYWDRPRIYTESRFFSDKTVTFLLCWSHKISWKISAFSSEVRLFLGPESRNISIKLMMLCTPLSATSTSASPGVRPALSRSACPTCFRTWSR